MKNKLLKGFTILEALISLMLISIVISITYSLTNLIGKQLSLFEEENGQILEYNLFNTTIMSDIEKANDFNIDNDILVLKSYDNTEIHYSIEKYHVLRQSAIETDTFKVQVIDYIFVSDGELNPLNKTFRVSLNVLNDTINTNYFLNKNKSEIINNIYFNED